jgi:hypothetical protein
MLLIEADLIQRINKINAMFSSYDLKPIPDFLD